MPTLRNSRRNGPKIVTGIAIASLFSGCAQVRTNALTSKELEVLAELNLTQSELIAGDLAYQQPGLSLIAGDPIAIQVALAGGFFDFSEDTPVYADVAPSDFE